MLTEKGSDCHIEGLAPRALYERAADKGDVNALLAMADAYGKGDLGLPPDAGKASEYYRRVIASEEARDAQKAEARKKIEELEKQP
jgi:TPR repeat protein